MRIPRLSIAIGVVLGCRLASPNTRETAETWQSYCCADGSPGSRHDCVPIAASDAAACRDDDRAPIECRPIARCSGPPEQCHCCRTAPEGACTTAIRHARRRVPAPAEPRQPPPSQRPAEGTVWSPY
jgi:hypothetical protein